MYDKELLQDMNAIKGKVSVTDGTPDYTEAVLKKYNIDMVTLCRGDSMMLIIVLEDAQLAENFWQKDLRNMMIHTLILQIMT